MSGNVTEWRPEKVVDFVVSNPPYRRLGKGRVSQGEERATARFESKAEFADFARCAALSLKTRGKFIFVHLPERLAELMDGLHEAKLEPKRLCMVHGRADETARMVMIEGGQGCRGGHEGRAAAHSARRAGRETKLTEQTLEYCPFWVQCRG